MNKQGNHVRDGGKCNKKDEGFQCTGEYTETLPVLIDIEYPLLVILFIS